ncbi:flagellar hook protein FlgE [Aliikangiella coralliicola]|uniref:Flagellar hook protein FlgE n=1 Tax=Aliikangiella coralliicola TaxID=2592383 RepID=A0A545U5X3_9GAMM|nr:flagellar hook protein FlgE [Aliikangiella coralliicola]TQV84870.1 flagellar hook protein FlgE [Aliikangiella coralliicola]
MSFNTALSGLNAAQAELNVTANNIANVATTGFKESRAEFADIFSTTSFGSSGTAIGNGVLLANVAQQFNQGNLEFTSNTLDLAVSGEGFFILSPSETNSNSIFTRNGEMGVDSNGFVVNNAGARLQVFPVNADGTVTATSLSSTIPLQLPQTAGVPTVTSLVDIGVNLPANGNILDPLAFDPLQTSTFNASTSLTVFDSLGESHVVTAYYVKIADNQWATYYNSTDANGATLPLNIADVGPGDTAPVGAGGQTYHTLTFDNSGSFVANVPSVITTTAIDFLNGSDPTQLISFNYANNNATQFSSPFTVNVLDQNGFPIGRLTGVEISDTGVVRANFSNGQTTALGKIALARFQNAQGLGQVGNNSWQDTIDSGAPLVGEALTSSFGQVRSGALEVSNVDLTAQLVNLIAAQRNFQANAKSIETNNTVTQAIINIR